MKIPQCSPYLSYLSAQKEIDAAVQRVLSSGWYILGKEVEAFEKLFADWLGAKFCIGVANGTDADELLLKAIGIKAGDKVTTVANTAVATVAAIERAGGQVRFADIDPETFTMSPLSLADLLKKESDIKAVIAVHLFGHPADLNPLAQIADQYGIPVIEDCAQAHGAMIGTQYCGTICRGGAFSFYPTKNLGALGDGGAVVTNEADLAENLMALRQYGWKKRYISEFAGVNSRLDEMQAAILAAKLVGLVDANEKRRCIAKSYTEKLSDLNGLILPIEKNGFRHVYHQYVIRVLNGRRDELLNYLNRHGIGCAVHYPVPIHLQKGYRETPLPVSLPVTEEINPQLLSLPMFPGLTPPEIDHIANSIREFFA